MSDPANGGNEPQLPAVKMTARDYLPLLRGSEGDDYCSLPQVTRQDIARVASIMTGEHRPLVECGNMTLLVEHCVISSVDKLIEATGEVVRLPLVILIDINGVGYKTSGVVPCNSLRKLLQSKLLPPWIPPLPLFVKPWSRGPDRKSVSLVLDLEAYLAQPEPTAQAKPQKKK